jgi:hypothetical protein
MKNIFVITDTPIQSTMIVTAHAVKNLIRGAEAYNNDINAIDGWCVDNVAEIILSKTSFPQEVLFKMESTVFW